jgi:hypothetical protein
MKLKSLLSGVIFNLAGCDYQGVASPAAANR